MAAIWALYSGYQCTVKNAGKLSRIFPFKRGVRQGDPMSSILYALSLEPLILALKSKIGELAFTLKDGQTFPCTAYADDLTLFIRSKEGIEQALLTVMEMSKYSEARLNIQKTKAFIVNGSPGVINCDLGSSRLKLHCGENIKILGVVFSENQFINRVQWDATIQSSWRKLRSAFHFLKTYTYYRRAIWANTKLWPRWLYILKTLHPSREQLLQMKSMLSEAIWLGSRHWLPFKILVHSKSGGGLNLVSPEHKIFAIRICMMASVLQMQPSHPVRLLAGAICDSYEHADLGLRILHTRLTSHYGKSLPAVYVAALEAWKRAPINFDAVAEVDILDLPVMRCSVLLNLPSPVDISFQQAKEMGIATIRDLIAMKEIKTRLWERYISCTLMALKEWREIHFGQNPCEASREEKISQFKNIQVAKGCNVIEIDTLTSGFVIRDEEGEWHSMNLWNPKFIYSIVIAQTAGDICCQNVPSEAWAILVKSPAPPSHRNFQWRFLHGQYSSTSFLVKTGVMELEECPHCGYQDVSEEHCFGTCPIIHKARLRLEEDLSALGLGFLDAKVFKHLFPDPTYEHRLASFLIMAFKYTINLSIKRQANNSGHMDSHLFLILYNRVINKHLKYLHDKDMKAGYLGTQWDFWAFKEVIVKRFSQRILVRSVSGEFQDVGDPSV